MLCFIERFLSILVHERRHRDFLKKQL